ncbi:hypothetical protein [Microvirga lotononidis]|uniref:Uncharacterized protein n=1 Tax=Microvirga lotononidis TaxID=864069 RepID=I4YP14_9HYPH|nr:hypothetical protein [Microvirga lotononidis]EIM25706.1 hypothetical protein MicloDRAFT_00064330 [Microvirga lotononidis]WQO25642.1 trna delta -isopentenylpyrophosphate transferase [Microvirga lotononidis]
MNATDKKISETLARFDEPMAGNTWKVQGTTVIYHKALERIAAKAKIQFDVPTILRAEKEEAVLMVVGRMGDRMEWSIGEATIGMNYRVSGKQAAYPYAMSEKRAKDRVILKLIELSGILYSEEEADEFKEARPLSTPSSEPSENEKKAVVASKSRQDEITDFKLLIEEARTVQAVTDLMQDEGTQAWLEKLPAGERDEIRAYAVDKMKSLGWQPKRAA